LNHSLLFFSLFFFSYILPSFDIGPADFSYFLLFFYILHLGHADRGYTASWLCYSHRIQIPLDLDEWHSKCFIFNKYLSKLNS